MEADRAEFKAWEHKTARDRSAGHFFQSLYQSDAGTSEGSSLPTVEACSLPTVEACKGVSNLCNSPMAWPLFAQPLPERHGRSCGYNPFSVKARRQMSELWVFVGPILSSIKAGRGVVCVSGKQGISCHSGKMTKGQADTRACLCSCILCNTPCTSPLLSPAASWQHKEEKDPCQLFTKTWLLPNLSLYLKGQCGTSEFVVRLGVQEATARRQEQTSRREWKQVEWLQC